MGRDFELGRHLQSGDRGQNRNFMRYPLYIIMTCEIAGQARNDDGQSAMMREELMDNQQGDKSQNELLIVMKAKALCKYVILITQKSPKHYRFTFVSRMQNLCLDIIENIYLANAIWVGDERDSDGYQKRLDLQHQALAQVRLLAYISQLALENKCILPKQYEQISKHTTECLYLLYAWSKSDKKRHSKN